MRDGVKTIPRPILGVVGNAGRQSMVQQYQVAASSTPDGVDLEREVILAFARGRALGPNRDGILCREIDEVLEWAHSQDDDDPILELILSGDLNIVAVSFGKPVLRWSEYPPRLPNPWGGEQAGTDAQVPLERRPGERSNGYQE